MATHTCTENQYPLIVVDTPKEQNMKEVTFKRLSDEVPVTVMSDEIFDCISDDPEFIKKHIADNPPLCMLVHKDLNPIQINKLVETSNGWQLPAGSTRNPRKRLINSTLS